MKKLMAFCKLCLFHEKLSHCTVPGAIAVSSTCTPEGGRSLVPKPQCVRAREEQQLSRLLESCSGTLSLRCMQ
ncbi:unnamed protein product [Sphagnum troendelagicum]|uniref:Secreted protein n=1 Tax=Sphagnum troendelagicum TaxID=128251 RepID=A0ABP0URZ9_9BRYO